MLITKRLMLLHSNQIYSKFEILINSNTLSVDDNSSEFIQEIIRMVIYPEMVKLTVIDSSK